MQSISIIGYGKMAKAIAVALNGKFKLEIIGRNKIALEAFLKDNKLKNGTIIHADSAINLEKKKVIFAIKPYALDYFTYNGKAEAIFSVMAGISIEKLKAHTKSKHYIRVMPNIASLVQKGVNIIFVDSKKIEKDSKKALKGDEKNGIKQECEDIFSLLGSCIFVEKESFVDSAGAISGCGTAYLGLIAEAMIDAGVREGLSLEVSKKVVRGLFSGFSTLFANNEAHSIRLDTTSPAGTTIEALAILENRGVRSAFIDAIHAAHNKAKNI